MKKETVGVVLSPLSDSENRLNAAATAYARSKAAFQKAKVALKESEDEYTKARVDFNTKYAEVASKSKVQPLDAD